MNSRAYGLNILFVHWHVNGAEDQASYINWLKMNKKKTMTSKAHFVKSTLKAVNGTDLLNYFK